MTEEEWKQFKDDANNDARVNDISKNHEELDAIYAHVFVQFEEMYRHWCALENGDPNTFPRWQTDDEDSCEDCNQRLPRFCSSHALYFLLAICAKRMMLGGISADDIRDWLEHSQKHW